MTGKKVVAKESSSQVDSIINSLEFIETFIGMMSTLATTANLTDLVQRINQSACHFTHAAGGRLYVLDYTGSHLLLKSAIWDNVHEDTCLYDERLNLSNDENSTNDYRVYCATTGQSFMLDDAYGYTTLNLTGLHRSDLILNRRTGPVIVYPLKNHLNQIVGVLELVSTPLTMPQSFTSLMPIIEAFVSLSAVVISNHLLLYKNQQLVATLDQSNQALMIENKNLKKAFSKPNHYSIIGDSEPMLKAFSLVDKVVNSPVSVFLNGETGTGKEVFARTIHQHSNRAKGEFVAQNCAALPENLLESELFGYKKGAFTGAMQDKPGLFDMADGGTLFLDEIGDMPIGLQAKLLRVLQESEIRALGATQSHKVDVRIITATHCHLEEKIKQGEFREDLFFRLSVFPITLPALKDRKSDIPALINHFLRIYQAQYMKKIKGISPQTLNLLQYYHFPGNVRELQNIIERAVLLCEDDGSIEPQHLSENVIRQSKAAVHKDVVAVSKDPSLTALLDNCGEMQLKDVVNAFEKRYIETALAKHEGNQTKTAAALKMPRRTLVEKIARLSIQPMKFV